MRGAFSIHIPMGSPENGSCSDGPLPSWKRIFSTFERARTCAEETLSSTIAFSLFRHGLARPGGAGESLLFATLASCGSTLRLGAIQFPLNHRASNLVERRPRPVFGTQVGLEHRDLVLCDGACGFAINCSQTLRASRTRSSNVSSIGPPNVRSILPRRR